MTFNLNVFCSPAKVNLFFKVIKKRDDGLHEIRSLMQAVDLFDYLEITTAREDSFEVIGEQNIPDDSTNLVLRALDCFRCSARDYNKYRIILHKHIPIQSGLGGGSSNAATTLFALNQINDNPFSISALMKMGEELGADVPFFFSEGIAFASGFGEIIENLSNFQINSFWIAKPKNLSLATRGVFKKCIPSHSTREDDHVLLDEIQNQSAGFVNQLEPAAFKILPKLQEIKKNLEDLGFSSVCMTGSGTCFMCFGNISCPHLEGVEFYRVNPLYRNPTCWYEQKEVVHGK